MWTSEVITQLVLDKIFYWFFQFHTKKIDFHKL